MKWIRNSMDQKLLSLVHGMWGVSYNFTNLYECVVFARSNFNEIDT